MSTSRPLIIGLTGGIGSGKTAASDYFKQLGIDIVDADEVARLVVAKGSPALARISEHFGSSILRPDGELNRAQLRDIIFQSPEQKTWLEQLLHPLIRLNITEQLANVSSPYTLFVSPLLLETDQQQLCDRILVIDVPVALQLERASNRDNNNREQIQRIIDSQTSRQERLKLADDVIDNSEDVAALQQKIATLHTEYLTLSPQL
ncbi:dephospho-CoA kinase [Dasania marina]|uniref:dephospho-CoA kinase n=1 Tax=Dasania marina TaxID=471499 RepID=UPI000378E773|nr:dephospho-CoA kinase [Dasania marina]